LIFDLDLRAATSTVMYNIDPLKTIAINLNDLLYKYIWFTGDMHSLRVHLYFFFSKCIVFNNIILINRCFLGGIGALDHVIVMTLRA
jgi:hypothetical protein